MDLAQVRVDAVGERDVNNAIGAAEGHGGLGAVTREGIEPFTGPASQQYSKRIFHKQA